MGNNPFREMLKTVRALEELPEKFLDAAGPLSVSLASRGFILQVDPYGDWWAETVTGLRFDKRDGLRNALRVSNVRLRNLMVMNLDHHAFKYHQGGTIYLPERLMVPVVRRGLGQWAASYHELARRIWHQLIEKGRSGG